MVPTGAFEVPRGLKPGQSFLELKASSVQAHDSQPTAATWSMSFVFASGGISRMCFTLTAFAPVSCCALLACPFHTLITAALSVSLHSNAKRSKLKTHVTGLGGFLMAPLADILKLPNTSSRRLPSCTWNT